MAHACTCERVKSSNANKSDKTGATKHWQAQHLPAPKYWSYVTHASKLRLLETSRHGSEQQGCPIVLARIQLCLAWAEQAKAELHRYLSTRRTTKIFKGWAVAFLLTRHFKNKTLQPASQ